MPHAHGGTRLYHLGWRANGDSFDVALAVNRVLAAGGHAWRLRATSNQLDAGDYLIELTASQLAAIAGHETAFRVSTLENGQVLPNLYIRIYSVTRCSPISHRKACRMLRSN